MNINAEIFFKTYLNDQILGIAQGGPAILNATGGFKEGIEKVVETAKNATITTINNIETMEDFMNQ